MTVVTRGLNHFENAVVRRFSRNPRDRRCNRHEPIAVRILKDAANVVHCYFESFVSPGTKYHFTAATVDEVIEACEREIVLIALAIHLRR